MGAKRLTVVPITEYREERVSLNAIEVLPDRFQTRATTDPEVVHTYYEWIRKGTDMGSVIVVHTADDRLILADGFHRYAAHQKLKLRSIKCQIREGTETDAILVGIEQNAALAKLRGLTEEDKRHAAELLIRNEETWDWSDNEISRRTGISAVGVARLRTKLLERIGVALPDRVKAFKDGVLNGKTFAYRKLSLMERRPHLCPRRKKFVVSLDGKTHLLGKDAGAANDKLLAIQSLREATEKVLSSPRDFRDWLMRRGVRSTTIKALDKSIGGSSCGAAVFRPLASVNLDDFLSAVARVLLARGSCPDFKRAIVVGYVRGISSGVSRAIPLAERLGVEFLTPEEFVAEFGSKGEADQPDGDPPES